ncbi:DUF1697 domain-containing protein [Aquimarina sp. M1]
MKKNIALLRGINVGGHKKIKMADLKQMFEKLGCSSVVTYIQSGNVVFENTSDDLPVLETKIRVAIKKHFDFDVPVIVMTHQTLNEILQNNPFADKLATGEIDSKKMYFMFLCDQPNPLAVKELSTISYNPEEFTITKKVIYLHVFNGYGKTKLNSNFFEKKLRCNTTTRNLRTMNKLLELSFLRV